MNNVIKIMNWIIENKEWIFGDVGTAIISFFLGRKSVQWNITLSDKSKK